MTPTSSLADRGEGQIINGLGNMNIGGGGFGSSPRGIRGIPSWDRENPAGAIGGHRSFSTNYDARPQGGPQRQPRGPLPERGTGMKLVAMRLFDWPMQD